MAKTASWVFGVILVIAAIWGFFAQPAIGFIAADTVSSIIHLVAGLVLVFLANKASAPLALKVIGIVYVLWAILGFVGWNFTAADATTNWFYLVVGVVVAVLGFMAKKGSDMGASQMPPAAPQM